jgi:hypothetical protein
VEAASGREITGLDGGSIFSALSLAPDGKSLAGDSGGRVHLIDILRRGRQVHLTRAPSLRREGRLQ